jgi:methionyl-tRNA formyltransferase
VVGVARLSARYSAATLADRVGHPRSVVATARRLGVPVRRLRSINDLDYLGTLGPRKVDVLLSLAAPEIFRRDALAAARQVVNVHSGRLPAYRGMMPTFWALAAGENSVTVTVHEMVERLDAAPILGEFEVPGGSGESAFDVAARAKDVADREVARLLARLGPAGRAPDRSEQTAYGFPRRMDSRRLRARGRRLL